MNLLQNNSGSIFFHTVPGTIVYESHFFLKSFPKCLPCDNCFLFSVFLKLQLIETTSLFSFLVLFLLVENVLKKTTQNLKTEKSSF